MRLDTISIENCRSIERASLERLSQINVLLGRNNAGKSAFMHALWFLAQKAQGGGSPSHRTVRNGDPELVLAITLRCALDDEERSDFIRQAFLWRPFEAERFEQAMASPLARLVEFRCSTMPRMPDVMHLESTNLMAEDGHWSSVQRLDANRQVQNPAAQIADFSQLNSADELTSERLSLAENVERRAANLMFQNWGDDGDYGTYLQRRFIQFLKRIFFFQPSRRSADELQANVGATLAPDGSNLPQILLRVRTNNEEQFNAITRIIEGAIPDVGRLHTPMTGNMTQIGFRRPGLREPIPLHDMGTGIQQLLMMAVLLETTGSETTLCIEEPELNLHPGAQRFLLNRLQAQPLRQVFMTTHSPVFLNVGPAGSVYRVEIHENRSEATRIEGAEDLAHALSAIGARNSDVLLSDAVLFVEGESDKAILSAWAQTTGQSLEARNVSVLLVGSTEVARSVSRPRMEILHAISRGSPVPHRFVFDSDERSMTELETLRAILGDALFVLSCREIENFFLDSDLLSGRIADRLRARGVEPPGELTELVQTRMLEIAQSLQGVVLIKRIRAALPRLEGGPFPRELANELAREGNLDRLARRIERALRTHHAEWLAGAELGQVVADESRRTRQDWRDEGSILRHAPGADVLDRLFEEFGLHYDKTADGVALARAMRPNQIPAEIAAVLQWPPRLGEPV